MGASDALDVTGIEFPVLSLSKGVALVSRSPDELTTCGKGGLRNGWFNSLLLVDSQGQGWRVNGARKLHGVGPLWGYNIFLNQRIKVDLLVSSGPFAVSLDDVRGQVLRSLQSWHGWETEDGFEELKQALKSAESVLAVIALLEKDQDPPRQRRVST